MKNQFAETMQQAIIDAYNLAIVENAFKTAEFLETFSRFFRYTSRKRNLVLLSEEVRALLIYFQLQKVSKSVECVYEPDYDSTLIPHLILLNAIDEKIEILRQISFKDATLQIIIKINNTNRSISVEINHQNHEVVYVEIAFG